MTGTKSSSPGSPALRLAALLALECILLLALADGYIAWSGLDMRILGGLIYFQGADVEAHRLSENTTLHYELAPGADAVFGGGRKVTVNSLGFRDPPRDAAKPAGVKRIICLGSSNTYGALVNDGQTYPAQLERLLNARGRGKYEVWNAGVCTYMIPQNLEAARRAIREYSPDLLLFQLNNSGRRAFLLGQPFKRYFDADPGLYLENLRYAWPRPLNFLRHWRLFRAAVLYLNRVSLAGKDPAYDWNKTSELLPADVKAFREFYEQNKDKVRMAVLVVPVPGNKLCNSFDGLGIPVIRLAEKLPAAHDPEFDKIHPAPYVYRWYAEKLMSALPGLLPPRAAPSRSVP
ncbi:MAG: hypothetical protein NTY45_08885 [Elusimicrobia bacterium]|nr:hypothetical protein [Elusimicrobiota bacterium]